MSFENFPYSDFHDLNLDWIINEWKKTKKEFLTYEEAFKSLKDFVENYFENLDVQEEVNKKLDEMFVNGDFNKLFNSYIPYVTPQMYGAKADGITDDTESFQKCFDSNKKIVIPNGNYLVGTCNSKSNCSIELQEKAYITIKDDVFLNTTSTVTMTGGRFYGVDKAPEAKNYAKKVISGNINNINIYDTKFFQCIVLYQTSGEYCGFVSVINIWVYDSQFIVANSSLNYVSIIGSVFQKANDMIVAPNYENISMVNCSIENVTNLFSASYEGALFNAINIDSSYIEYTSLLYSGTCRSISVSNSWIYTDKTFITITKGPGGCYLKNNIVSIINNEKLADVINATLSIEFSVGMIKQNGINITKSNIADIATNNVISVIDNQGEKYTNITSDFIQFTGKFSNKEKGALTFDSETNKIYHIANVTGLGAVPFIPTILKLGKSSLLSLKPPTDYFAIETSSHILYYYDGSAWRNVGTGEILS